MADDAFFEATLSEEAACFDMAEAVALASFESRPFLVALAKTELETRAAVER